MWNVSYPMIQNVLLFFLLRDILRLRDLLSYSFKPLYLFILQGLSRKRVYRKIFKGLDWISFVQIKVWKNTSQIRGIKERSFLCHTQHDAFSFQYPTTPGCFYIICQILFKSLLLVGVCICLFLHLVIVIYSYKFLPCKGVSVWESLLCKLICYIPWIGQDLYLLELWFAHLSCYLYTSINPFDTLKVPPCIEWI